MKSESKADEIKTYYREKSEIDNYLATNKILFEKELKNGLGEQMISELNNPPKPNKKLARRLKIAHFFERLFNIMK